MAEAASELKRHGLAVTGLVLRRGVALAGLGILFEGAAAFILTRFITGYLHRVSPTDPAIFAAAAVILAGTAAAGCYIPSRRAARIDPAAALRRE